MLLQFVSHKCQNIEKENSRSRLR